MWTTVVKRGCDPYLGISQNGKHQSAVLMLVKCSHDCKIQPTIHAKNMPYFLPMWQGSLFLVFRYERPILGDNPKTHKFDW